MLKKLLRFKSSGIFTLILIIFVLYRQGATWLNNLQKDGLILSPDLHSIYGKQENVFFPPKDKKAIAIFWASWCAPCKLEMKRLESSIQSGKIPMDSIFAINPFESDLVITKFIQENNYSFTFIEDKGIGGKLDISSTPTTLFINNGEVESMSSGLSFIGIWRAEYFLD